MGFFSNLFGQAKELTKLGNAVANIRKMLDEYEDDKDPIYLVVSSWICKVGVVDMIQKNGWLPNYVVQDFNDNWFKIDKTGKVVKEIE